jgi:hypothetical protein
MKPKQHLVVVFLMLLMGHLRADDTLKLFNDKGIKKIKPYMSFYKDSTDRKTINEISELAFKKDPSKEDYFNFSFQHVSHWFKIVIKNTGTLPISQYLEINRAYYPVAELYAIDEDGDLEIFKSGSQIRFKDRPVPFNTITFNVHLNPQQTKTYYLHLNTKGLTLVFRPQLYEHQKLFKSNWSLNLYYGCYFGILLIVLINSIFFYYVERRIDFVYYFIMVLSVLLVNSFYSGYLLRVIQNFPLIEHHYRIYALAAYMSTISGSGFAIAFLSLKKMLPRWRQFLLAVIVLSTLCFIGTLFLPLQWFTKPSFYITSITAFIVSIAALIIYVKGDRAARFFFLGYLCLSLGILLYGLRVYNIVPENNLTIHAFEFGSMLEMIFLFLALADKQSTLKKIYETSQSKKIAEGEESTIVLKNLVNEQTNVLSQTETEMMMQKQKVQELEERVGSYQNIRELESVSHLLNKMVYSNLKLRLSRFETLLKEYSHNSFIYFKASSEVGNAFAYSYKSKHAAYFVCGENELDKSLAPLFNVIIRAYFATYFTEDFDISPCEILKQLNYYVKKQVELAESDETLELRIAVVRIKNEEIDFSSAGQLVFLVNAEGAKLFGDLNLKIGDHQLPSDVNFQNMTIQKDTNKNTYLYLFGSGMLQLRGGIVDEIYGTKRMAELLPNLYTMQADDQKSRVQEIFNMWLLQANHTQEQDWIGFGFQIN